jgi:hypothetical protein
VVPFEALKSRRLNAGIVADFLRDHPDVTIRQLLSGEARRIIQARSDSVQATVPSFDREAAKRDGYTDAEIDAYLRTRSPRRSTGSVAFPEATEAHGDLALAESLAQQENLVSPWRAYATIWGLWAAIAIVAPAVLLAAFRWIASGFAPHEPRRGKAE